MKTGDLIPKGTIITIGKRNSVVAQAKGLEFITLQKGYVGEDSIHGKVTKDPNGWNDSEVYHTFHPKYDTCIFPGDMNNKNLVHLLDKEV